MAIVKNNLITTGFAGKIGNLVFRQRGGKTTVYTLSPRTKPLSELQSKAQRNFADAVRKAKFELSTP